MWFWYSLAALLCWSGSDLFSKIGCRESGDKTAYLKMVMAVGVVMGLHACYEIFVNDVEINLSIILTYLPVSLLYIVSMAIGYIGLRYIELSISSPICNSSGALVAILTLITAGLGDMGALQLIAITLVAGGVILLGVVEATEDDELRAARQEVGNRKYAKSFLALLLPILYCVLDAAGTFADSLVLETLDEGSAERGLRADLPGRRPACGGVRAVCQARKADRAQRRPQVSGCCRARPSVSSSTSTPSADKAHVAMSAPIIASYCMAVRAVEPPVPQGKAELEALRGHRYHGGGHCDYRPVRDP